jgi:hypothetical protein
MPTSLRGNSHGQLGYRKVNVRMTLGSMVSEIVELTPDTVRDPLAMATPFRRGALGTLTDGQRGDSVIAPSYTLDSMQENGLTADDNSIRFCTNFAEVPSLRDIVVSQIATGRKSTYARVQERALAWGANEFG